MYDTVITSARLIDGSGSEERSADIAIKDGVIVEVGKVDGLTTRTIDADGALVTPGFVDIHTHYDGQVSWDSELQPSVAHGVSTVVMGNCGVGFAPCRPSDRDRLVELMEGVEDIPGAALAEGLTWRWESFEQYLDALDAVPRSIDVCAQVTHDALRVYVMGEPGARGAAASGEHIADMRRLASQALDAGAIGISTGRSENHKSATGHDTPARFAATEELVGIAAALRGRDRGIFQVVSDFGMSDRETFDREFDRIEAVGRSAGRPVSVSCIERFAVPDQWRWIAQRAQRATDSGVPINLQVGVRAIGVLLGLNATFHPFMGFPSYKAISHLPLDERVAEMRRADFKARLLSETSEPVAGDGSPIPPMADQLLAALDLVATRLFRLGKHPDYEPSAERSLAAEASMAGRPALDVVYDALLEQGGHELLYLPLFNYSSGNLDTVAEMLRHPLALSALSDGGAHVGTVCDASFPTYMLMHWGRDRDDGLGLTRAVEMQTSRNARFIGLSDRGTIQPGKRADINVIDIDNLALERPYLVDDLPAGGKRLLQRASGYLHTMVAGVDVIVDDTRTAELPGRLVRSGQQTSSR
ncbi:MAG: amidohydrolase family protein [Actinobacteria bacterium]|nr:amidohydrolase family protein [Actinomycetota bacterium]MCB9389792.1 amidohydrolase family protein [Acidimicrobiia bacterium]